MAELAMADCQSRAHDWSSHHPRHAQRSHEFYRTDVSGIWETPLPHSDVPLEHRLWHLTHQPITDCLSGSNLDAFTESFQKTLRWRIERCPIGDNWLEVSDLYDFVYIEVIHVQLELLCRSVLP